MNPFYVGHSTVRMLTVYCRALHCIASYCTHVHCGPEKRSSDF